MSALRVATVLRLPYDVYSILHRIDLFVFYELRYRCRDMHKYMMKMGWFIPISYLGGQSAASRNNIKL